MPFIMNDFQHGEQKKIKKREKKLAKDDTKPLCAESP